MNSNALIIAAICTAIFYLGLAAARRTRGKFYRAFIRIGAIVLMVVCIGVLPLVMNESPATSELAGRYMFYMLIGGELVYKLLLVRLISLSSEKPDG